MDIYSLAFEFCWRNPPRHWKPFNNPFLGYRVSQSPAPNRLCNQVLTTAKSVGWGKDEKVCCWQCSMPCLYSSFNLCSTICLISASLPRAFTKAPISFLSLLDNKVINAVKILMC